jgi:ribosomal protein S18 acetylase RimI-like enzyme
VRLSVTGTWPGTLVLRRGWARADARPWNTEVPDAQLRLVRGGGQFLASCTRLLLSSGAPAVISPPLTEGTERPWRAVGFRDFLVLELFRRQLAGPVAPPPHPVTIASRDDWRQALKIDRESFRGVWRLDGRGLAEALDATPRSALLLVGRAGEPAGFAVVGSSGTMSYLQRVAVHPRHQRSGLGRALLREAMRWARSGGARSMLLNTQPGNHASAALYRTEGFTRLSDRLVVLRRREGEEPD